MALFKPFMGNRASLDSVAKHAGYVYLCVDDGSFHLDFLDAEGNVQRRQINADEANKLVGYDISTSLNATDTQIPTSQAVLTAIEASKIIYVGPDEPTDPNIKVWINTAEEGTGVVPVLPRVATITLNVDSWAGSSAPYSQVVEVATVTSATKIELNATVAQIISLQNDDIALMAENSDGVVTVYSFGGKPSSTMTMQVTLTEVSYV